MAYKPSPLVARVSLRSAAGDGFYSPHSQYLGFNKERIRPWAQNAKDGLQDQPSDVREVESVIQHELAHWIQGHGTSIGAFLARLRGRQLDLFKRFPRAAGAELIQQLFSRRFASVSALPLIRTSKSVLAEEPEYSRQEVFLGFRSQWWNLQLGQSVFEQPDEVVKTRLRTGEALRVAFSDSPVDEWRQSVPISSDDEEATLRKIMSQKIKTNDLLEGFASANQLLYYGLYQKIYQGDWLQQRISQTIQSISTTHYGAGIRHLASVSSSAKRDMIRGMAVFCAIADLSLHPSFEEIHDAASSGGPIANAFERVYPPSRFVVLCEAADGLPQLSVNAKHEEIGEFQAEVLRRAGMTIANEQFQACDGLPSVHDLTYKGEILAKYTLADVERTWQNNAMELRKSLPALFVLPSPQYLLDRGWLTELRNDRDRSSIVLPPLWSDEEKHIYFHLNHAASHCLIFWSLVANITHSILCGHKRVDLSAFPEDVQESGIMDDARSAIFRHCGFDTAPSAA
ncbi:hypothetical protein CBA19CS22_11895 [Caballeronia novacaledonica]|uniref:Uncharacterized protein n=1 Tax=Caballeronia novacaledonica TaxID=1544861 RepID=A0ACB5QQY7_9BURK|nr:hypothetical protein CBA19CS22_11895 [Caballeronia novacaledonica]